MATIINTPGSSSDESGVGMLLGIVLVVIVAILFIVFALPALRNNQTKSDTSPSIDVHLDGGTSGGNGNTKSGTGY